MRKILASALVIMLALAPTLAEARGGGFHGGGGFGGFRGGGFHGGGGGFRGGFGGFRGGGVRVGGWHGSGGWHGGGGGWNRGWGGRGYGWRGPVYNNYYGGGYYGGWGGWNSAAPWIGLGLGVLGGLAIDGAYGNAYRNGNLCSRIIGYDTYGQPIPQTFTCY